ncbi:DNA-binding transcriptional response regulator [Streptomyces cinereoruber]|uniref:response regulator n=1 Tax=Streptomyces cinereoruber TaxID=67260 RepID=UPI00363D6E64
MGIVDDVTAEAEALVRFFEDFDLQALIMPRPAPRATAEEYLATFPPMDVLVCDHLLRNSWTVAFTGAELAARANSRPQKLPAIVMSTHVGTHEASSIHQWRADIPAVVPKGAESEQVLEAVQYAIEEAAGKVSRERRRFRTPVEVLAVYPEDESPYAEVLVSGWSLTQSARLPLLRLEQDTGTAAETLPPGTWLRAEVNCYARRAEDLCFTNITLAPQLSEEIQAL